MTGSTLEGIKVLEFANMVSGPYCGKLLADLGADVIKVEPPEGDSARLYETNGSDGMAHSPLFLYMNTSKRGVSLDLNTDNDLGEFKKLIEWADILIDNHHPGRLADMGLDWAGLTALNPGLIYTSITPYGRTGPNADTKGDELTVLNAGGLANLLPARSKDISLPPVKLGGFPVGYHGGIAAALASIAAAVGKLNTGAGQLVEISLQEVIISLLAPIITGSRYHNTTWGRVPDRPPAMGRMQTSDGYIILGAADDHHFRAFRELMGKPPWAAADEWDDRGYRTHHLMDIAPMMEDWVRTQEKKSFFIKAAKKKIPIGYIASAKDVMESPQNEARQYFVEVDHPEAGKLKYAGWPYKMSASPPKVSRPAPLLGQHNDEIKRELAKASTPKSDAENIAGPDTKSLPLAGVRILDFCWVWAGPYACMLLASLGAEVIKIEGHKRTDLLRRSVPWPLVDPAPTKCPPNQAMSYNCVNMNKKSLTLDLSRPEGVELARRLAAMSDVVVDNMRPGALAKLGLGYDDLIKIRQDMIVVSSSSRGMNGPESEFLGFASIHHGMGGGAYITGHPEDHPSHGAGGDVDIMNATTAAFIIAAALYHRKQTGVGQFIDYSQCEGVSSTIGDTLLEYEISSRIPERKGNAHPFFAPHNVYPCWGVDRWLALEIHSDDEFARLAGVINMPQLAEDPRFKEAASRKKNEKELDKIIGEWTRERDRDFMVTEFCAHGLAAAPSRTWEDIYADQHLRQRKALVPVDHPELGELEMIGLPWNMSGFETPSEHAPLLGQHNRIVLRELLGLSDEEISDLKKNEIIM